MKRANGLGTLFYNKATNRWCVKVTIGWEDNKQKTKQLGSFKTEEEAQKFFNNYTYERKTLGEVIEEWFQIYKENNSEKSVGIYKSVLKNFSDINHLRIYQLNMEILADFIEKNPKYERHIRTILNNVFKYLQQFTHIDPSIKLVKYK